jgi:SAM-dependent methyltransferase
MPFFQYWGTKLGVLSESSIVYHRKLWEFVYICQALHERGMLKTGNKGVGFGVGVEKLPALFASMGCKILATDLDAAAAQTKGWRNSSQSRDSLAELNKDHICSDSVFRQNVSYRNVDMNNIPDDIGVYDFAWSACSLEHLGSLEHGLNFIKNSLKVLRPGGIAVYTTEYNLSSNTNTLESEGCSIYRRQDIEKIVRELENEGHYVWPVDYHEGISIADDFVDFPPFCSENMHLRLLIDKYISTSIGIIIRKGSGRD